MSVARTARRRRLQAVQGHTHLARIGRHKGHGRPIYRKRQQLDIHAAIAREKIKAAKMAKAAGKKG